MKRRIACLLTATLTAVTTVGWLSAGTASAGTETVTAIPGGGWFDDPRTSSDGATDRIVNGPGTPPEGTGSLELGVNAGGQIALMTNALTSELFPPTLTLFHPFAGLSGSWSTYVPAAAAAANQGAAVSVRFEAYDNGNVITGNFTTVVFEPLFQDAVIPDQWQTWTINDSAKVYQTRPGSPCNQVTQCSFAQFKRTYPRAAFLDVQLGLGSFSAVPQPIASYVDAVHLTFADGTLDTNFEVLQVGEAPVAPVANPDQYATPVNQPLVVEAPSGVLLNDTAQNGHLMTAAVGAGPAHGQLQLAASGAFTYTPQTGFTGVDTFTYTATDTISGLVSAAATATITVTAPPPGPLPPANGSRFVPIAPTRIVDTRTALGASGPVAAGSSTVITAVGTAGIPAGATAVAVNITATEAGSGGYVQAFPTGTNAAQATSNVNIDHRNATVADLALVGLDSTGKFTMFSLSSTQLVVDVFGYFVPAATSGAGRLVPLDPVRVLDTRTGLGATGPLAAGGSVDLSVTGRIPADAEAVVMTLTATNTQAPGFVQAVPTGGATAVGASSNVNIDITGDTTANTAIVPVGAGGKVTLFTNVGADLVADVVGYFTGSGTAASTAGLFVPVTPQRVADTRVTGAVASGNSTIIVPVAGRPALPESAPTAIAGTLTATETSESGFVQVFPTGSTATIAGSTSSLNYNGPGRTQAVATISGSTSGSLSIFTSSSTHLIYDISGYFI